MKLITMTNCIQILFSLSIKFVFNEFQMMQYINFVNKLVIFGTRYNICRCHVAIFSSRYITFLNVNLCVFRLSIIIQCYNSCLCNFDKQFLLYFPLCGLKKCFLWYTKCKAECQLFFYVLFIGVLWNVNLCININ